MIKKRKQTSVLFLKSISSISSIFTGSILHSNININKRLELLFHVYNDPWIYNFWKYVIKLTTLLPELVNVYYQFHF